MRLPVFSLAVLVLAFSTNLRAARIGVDRDPPNATPVTSASFGFGADNNGGGDFAFINESGQDWKELTVLTLLPAQMPVPTCSAGAFRTCNVAGSVQGGNVAYTISFGTGQFVAIPNGVGFSVDLNDQSTEPIDRGGWPAGQDFSARANDIAPEPGAGMLTLFGSFLAGAVWLQRRRS